MTLNNLYLDPKFVDLVDGQAVLRPFPTRNTWINQPYLVIRPELAGVCRSDLKEIQGSRSIGSSFGHEFVGHVVETSKSSGFQCGDRLCFNPNVKGISRTSGFGDLIAAWGPTSALVNAFTEVDATLPAERAVFLEPLACATRCIKAVLRHLNFNNLKNTRVAIIGAGIFGILIGLVARLYEAEVTVFNRSSSRLLFLQSTNLYPREALKLTSSLQNSSFDIAICCTSMLTADVLSSGAASLRPHGLLHLFGGTRAGDVLPETNVDIDKVRRQEVCLDTEIQGKRFLVGGVHGATQSDFALASSLLRNYPELLRLERLIARRSNLADLPSALNSLIQNDIAGRHVVEFL